MRRGYSLPLVLLVLSTLALAITSLAFVVAASSKTTGTMLGRRKALYACDGVIRGLSVKARDYFAVTPTPDPVTLRDHLCGSAFPSCTAIDGWFPGFTVEAVTVGTGTVNTIGEIANGPFAGQSARRTDMTLKVELLHESGRRCRVSQSMVNGQIGLFQFAVFSGIPMDLFQPATMNISGRVHINGSFCAGGGGFALTIERLTVSGQLRSGCGNGSVSVVPSTSQNTNGFNIVDRVSGTAKTIDSSNDGATGGWANAALARWNGNALDQSHGVPLLRLPVATAAAAQPGNNQDGAARTNIDTLRLLVDPSRTGDSPDAAAERLYNKADIRIVNGVWYKRDGTVLWSDHTGAVTIAEQATLEVPSLIPAAPSGPHRYSYYERDPAGSVANGGASVVSYGALFRVSATDWRPGFLSGAAIAAANTNEQLVQGTRSGFVDRRVALASGQAAGRVLPLNFDVGAFVAALGDTAAGELGDIFGGGTSFNGIVWIGNTWPDHDRGFTSNTGSNVFAATAPPAALDGANRHTLPPLPLCKDTGGGVLAGVENQVACAPGLPRVNAVRVHNASVIEPGILPRGLTIVTNGPLYILGDVNTSSLVAGAPGTPRTVNPAGPWVPVMLAGDAVTILSTAWRDHVGDRAFGATPVQIDSGCNDGAKPASASATPTTIVAAVLAGHVDTGSTSGGGINNFPRFAECWSGVDNRIIGSLVIGYRSVYQRARFHLFAYRPPKRLWDFDTNFANPANQPPGTPSFFVQAVERWDRD